MRACIKAAPQLSSGSWDLQRAAGLSARQGVLAAVVSKRHTAYDTGDPQPVHQCQASESTKHNAYMDTRVLSSHKHAALHDSWDR